MGAWRLGHRPALDGLRGVAISLVVVAHTGAPGLMPLGGAGVTLFFVLSGFLITGLLLEEREETGALDLRGFYQRRVRRLGPAFVALTAAVVALGPVLGSWWFEWRDLPPVLLYVGNWVEATNSVPGVALGALSITWSLAIEEQFYILWPLAIGLLARRRRVVVAASLLAAVSLLWRLSLAGGSAVRVYYGSDTVAFALLVGALAVGLRLGGGPGRTRTWPLVPLGLVLVWCTTWPLGPLVTLGLPIVALASVAAMWSCTGAGRVRLLEGRSLRWLGSRSYGLYLWHGPLLWAMRDHFALAWPITAALGVPASLVLAEASWRYVEAPWRKRRVTRATSSLEGTAATVG
jgi:peptidoglycan/LPS O-acetylase OafA/YrhL